jgi:glycosyl transferase family 87
MKGVPDKNMKMLKIALNVALLGILIWFLAAHQQRIGRSILGRDSLAYWAAGKFLVHSENPYSPANVMALQQSQGYAAARPLMLRTPPWSLWMVLPLGWLSSFWAWVVWEGILLFSLIIALRLLWRIYGTSQRPPVVFLLAGYGFAAVPACLAAGQMGIVLALGIVLFFFFEQDDGFLAGAALLIPFTKPHIFSLIWLILAVWVVSRRRWSVLAGFGSGLLLSTGVAISLDPAVFWHYREMLSQAAIQKEFIPSFAGMVRLLFFRRFFVAQFVPLCAGLIWSGAYYWRNRGDWSWREHGPALLLVSVVTTPYSSWMADEAILLPAILVGVLWMHRAKLNIRSRLVVLMFILLNVLLLLILRAQVQPSSGIYFWSSLVWLGWYRYARSFRCGREAVRQPSPDLLQV